MDWRTVSQEGDPHLLHAIEVGRESSVVSTPLHFVHTSAAVIDCWVAVLNAGCEKKQGQHVASPLHVGQSLSDRRYGPCKVNLPRVFFDRGCAGYRKHHLAGSFVQR